MKYGQRAAVLGLLLLAAACTQQQFSVRPVPDFVQMAIEPGDSVIVTTTAGETVEFVVVDVTEDALHGEDRRFGIADIVTLKKLARQRPPTPCGGEERLGCSVPLLVALASEDHAHYREVFYDACEQHDYCYRHGVRTYGLNREYCDREFLNNMNTICPRPKTSTFGTIIEALSGDMDTSLKCREIANDFYVAARDFGEKHFRDVDSTYCEYDGAP